jgi:hypothetical protein
MIVVNARPQKTRHVSASGDPASDERLIRQASAWHAARGPLSLRGAATPAGRERCDWQVAESWIMFAKSES